MTGISLSLLQRVQQLQGFAETTAKTLYSSRFPLEARILMDEFIEQRIYNDPGFRTTFCYGGTIAALIKAFLEAFHEKVKDLSLVYGERMRNIFDGLLETHRKNPLAILKLLCFNAFVEKQLVEGGLYIDLAVGFNPSIYSHFAMVNIVDRVREFDALIQRLNVCKNLIMELNEDANSFRITQEDIRAKKLRFLCEITINVNHLIELQNAVVDTLDHWKLLQFGDDKESFNEGLDTLQLWFETLAGLILDLLQQLNAAQLFENKYQSLRIQPTGHEARLQELPPQLNEAFDKLVKRSLIVEIQPTQVVITKTGPFDAHVRTLLGGMVTIPDEGIQVKATLISRTLATHLEGNEFQMPAEPSSTDVQKIEKDTSNMTKDEPNRLVAKFGGLLIPRIIRDDNDEESEVTAQRHYIKFDAAFIVNGNTYEVSTLSLPIVVVVAINQKMRAWGAIVYFYACSDQKSLFYGYGRSFGRSLAVALNRFCAKETGRPLTTENLMFLLNKFKEAINIDIFDCVNVPLAKFSKDYLPMSVDYTGNRPGFSFWEWFYVTMMLIKQYLVETWRQDLIEGFISKAVATQRLLNSVRDGTFILRFTESLDYVKHPSGKVSWKGSITIMFGVQPEGGQKIVISNEPFISDDLARRPLSNRVLNFEQAKFLYPNIPKTNVFEYQADEHQRAGYSYDTITRALVEGCLRQELLSKRLVQKSQRVPIAIGCDHNNF